MMVRVFIIRDKKHLKQIKLKKENYNMELFKAAKEAMAAKIKFGEMDKRLKAHVINVEYNGIKIQVNGKNELLAFQMPDDLLKEKKEEIEKLVLAAFKSAVEKSQALMTEETKKLTADLKF